MFGYWSLYVFVIHIFVPSRLHVHSISRLSYPPSISVLLISTLSLELRNEFDKRFCYFLPTYPKSLQLSKQIELSFPTLVFMQHAYLCSSSFLTVGSMLILAVVLGADALSLWRNPNQQFRNLLFLKQASTPVEEQQEKQTIDACLHK